VAIFNSEDDAHIAAQALEEDLIDRSAA